MTTSEVAKKKRKLLFMIGSDVPTESFMAVRALKKLLEENESSWNEFVADLQLEEEDVLDLAPEEEEKQPEAKPYNWKEEMSDMAASASAMDKLRKTSKHKEHAGKTGTTLRSRNSDKFDKSFFNKR